MSVVIGIPAHDEERYIGSVLSKALGTTPHVYVVDDGSGDHTELVASSFNGVKVIRKDANEGYGAGIRTLLGLPLWHNAILVTLDGDGQHDPLEAREVAGPVARGEADICIGSRFLGTAPGMPGVRKAVVRGITRSVNTMTGFDLTDAQSGFRAYSQRARKLLAPKLHTTGMDTSVEIITVARELGLTIAEVPVTVKYEGGETSGQDMWSHGMGVVSNLMEFIASRGLKWFLAISTLLFFSGFALAVWALQLYLERQVLVPNIIFLGVTGMISGVGLFFMVMNFFALQRIREAIS